MAMIIYLTYVIPHLQITYINTHDYIHTYLSQKGIPNTPTMYTYIHAMPCYAMLYRKDEAS